LESLQLSYLEWKQLKQFRPESIHQMMIDKARGTSLKRILIKCLHGVPFAGLQNVWGLSKRFQMGADMQKLVNGLGRAGLVLKIWFHSEDDHGERLFVAPGMLEQDLRFLCDEGT
jgi:hypothetical protein